MKPYQAPLLAAVYLDSKIKQWHVPLYYYKFDENAISKIENLTEIYEKLAFNKELSDEEMTSLEEVLNNLSNDIFRKKELAMLNAIDNSILGGVISNSINNFICFGIEGTTCDEEHLYRIIGTFEDNNIKHGYNVKLIKNKSLGNMSFDTTAPNGSNVWETSILNKNTLNGTYLTDLGSYGNMIRDTAWNVGGYDTANGTAKIFLNAEKNNQSSLSKIGLIYASDYGYAAYPYIWANDLSDHILSNSKNWLVISSEIATITPNTLFSDYLFYINEYEYDSYLFLDSASIQKNIHPVFYLNLNVKYIRGTGTINDPYFIGE